MIRHISTFTLKDGADVGQIAKAIDELCDRVPGAIYRVWDTHPEHERIRKESILPRLTGVVRCQFRV